MKWYLLRNKEGMEVQVASEMKTAHWITQGYKLINTIDIKGTSKCKEG